VYRLRTNIVKNEKGDLVTVCHSIVASQRNHFSQLLNVHGINVVRQTDIHAAEPLVPEPSAFEMEMAIEKLKSDKSPDIDEIPAELIKAGGRTIHCEIHKLLNLFGIRGNCLRSGRSRSLCLFMRRMIKQTVVIIEAHHFCQQRATFYPTSCCPG